MGLQYFIQEGIEGSVNLNNMYKELNNEYFGGSLPKVPCSWNGRLKNSVGRAECAYSGIVAKVPSFMAKYAEEIPVSTNVELNMKKLKISLSKNFDFQLPDVKAVMLHEMVHIALFLKKKISGHHNEPEFDNWIKSLRDKSGLNIPMKEADYKASPKLKPKEGYALLIYEKSGKYGLALYSKNFVTNQKKWDDFLVYVGRVIQYSSKVSRIEMYKINHPIVSTMGAKRSGKSISWQYIDEETANDIRKKGKLIMQDGRPIL